MLTPENRAQVLPRFFGLSRREAEAVAASLRPAEVMPTRDVITAVRPAAPALRAATAQAALSAASPESPALRVHPDEPPAPVVVAAPVPPPPAPPPPRESVEMLDAELARMHVTVSRRFLEKLEAAKDALGHACPGGSAAEILERGLDLVLAQHAKRQGLVEKPRKGRRASRSDTIPAEVKREVVRRWADGPLCAPALDAGAEPAVPCHTPRAGGRWFHASVRGGVHRLIRVITLTLAATERHPARPGAAGSRRAPPPVRASCEPIARHRFRHPAPVRSRPSSRASLGDAHGRRRTCRGNRPPYW